MAALLTWIEATGPATWVRESPSVWAYPTVLVLHTVGLALVVGLSTAIDVRLLGAARRLPLASLTPAVALITWGFALSSATGILLFIADATHKAGQPVLYIKLGLIAAALGLTRITANIVHAGAVSAPAGTSLYDRLVAASSLALWAAAIAAGRLMAYL